MDFFSIYKQQVGGGALPAADATLACLRDEADPICIPSGEKVKAVAIQQVHKPLAFQVQK